MAIATQSLDHRAFYKPYFFSESDNSGTFGNDIAYRIRPDPTTVDAPKAVRRTFVGRAYAVDACATRLRNRRRAGLRLTSCRIRDDVLPDRRAPIGPGIREAPCNAYRFSTGTFPCIMWDPRRKAPDTDTADPRRRVMDTNTAVTCDGVRLQVVTELLKSIAKNFGLQEVSRFVFGDGVARLGERQTPRDGGVVGLFRRGGIWDATVGAHAYGVRAYVGIHYFIMRYKRYQLYTYSL
ncbi:hypothetical protein EVAR_86806_1 [Eumeta japonica]|uniref:Uncharacterized protein n=1 Tax=Eumeta variegata TaxID=151549 RepID=A0A4C1VRS7_EUMVA|nr:hypothetical protein EVAR_86806_1 [Eumeta japonica]